MIKFSGFVMRQPHLTHQEFAAYWRDHHAPLVLSHAGTLRIRRYVQTLPIDAPARSEAIRTPRHAPEFVFDGLGELWWDSFEDLDEGRRDPRTAAALQEILEDERRFVDFTRSQIWYGTERTVIPA